MAVLLGFALMGEADVMRTRYSCGGRLSDDEDGDDGVASFMQALVGTVAGSGADGRMEGWRAGGLRG